VKKNERKNMEEKVLLKRKEREKTND